MSVSLETLRRIIAVALGVALLSAPVRADQPATTPRIGLLLPPISSSPQEVGLREGLHELGYFEGKNIAIESRSAGTNEEARAAAHDLARSKVDLIVAFGSHAARAALEATTNIPVLFSSGDPVAAGLAASLTRPDGNGTGLSAVTTELYIKCLEFLRELRPRARHITFLHNPANPLTARRREELRTTARALGMQMAMLEARNDRELDAALRTVPRGAVDGMLVSVEQFFLAHKAEIAASVRRAQVPACFPDKEYHDDRVLMSYGTNRKEAGRKLAVCVDKILKGAKPSELPIEEMSKYELVIDLRVARQLGIKVPQELLQRADEVIR